jgi:hypothetical protein
VPALGGDYHAEMNALLEVRAGRNAGLGALVLALLSMPLSGLAQDGGLPSARRAAPAGAAAAPRGKTNIRLSPPAKEDASLCLPAKKDASLSPPAKKDASSSVPAKEETSSNNPGKEAASLDDPAKEDSSLKEKLEKLEKSEERREERGKRLREAGETLAGGKARRLRAYDEKLATERRANSEPQAANE